MLINSAEYIIIVFLHNVMQCEAVTVKNLMSNFQGYVHQDYHFECV